MVAHGGADGQRQLVALKMMIWMPPVKVVKRPSLAGNANHSGRAVTVLREAAPVATAKLPQGACKPLATLFCCMQQNSQHLESTTQQLKYSNGPLHTSLPHVYSHTGRRANSFKCIGFVCTPSSFSAI